MSKFAAYKKQALCVLLVFLFGGVSCAGAFASAGSIPVPGHKPDRVVAETGVQAAAQDLLNTPATYGPVQAAVAYGPVPPVEERGFFDDVNDAVNIIGDSVEALLQIGPPSPPPFLLPSPPSPPSPPRPAPKPMPAEGAPLSSKDAEIYKQIFALQEAGDMAGADQELEKLGDFRLRGHVLYQRYMHPTAYKATYEELRNWVDVYGDHPGAEDIHRMALRRQPQGFDGDLRSVEDAPAMLPARALVTAEERKYQSTRQRTPEQKKNIEDLSRLVRQDVGKGKFSQAMQSLEKGKAAALLDPVEKDLLLTELAAGYLYQDELERAYELAARAVARSGVHVPQAAWLAGLAAWRRGDYKQAARHFEVAGRSPYASGWMAASGAYWAARAHTRTGNAQAVENWLGRASDHPHTFYGLIATRALGRDLEFNWKIPAYTKDFRDLLMSTPSGSRGIALVAAGQRQLAESELIRLNTKDNKIMRKALLAYAGHAELPGLAMQLGHTMEMDGGGVYNAALYPMGPWKPKEGYKVDPALIHAIMRQESGFDSGATSKKGAKGLMQVMPTTASDVAENGDGTALDNPQTNLEIGQRYLEELLASDTVSGDLFSLLIAYNAGPGNLAKWKKSMPNNDDPLLFIETIPSSQARDYVERVLANYWIYRLRENLPTPTLNAVAAGRNPQYAALEGDDAFNLADRR